MRETWVRSLGQEDLLEKEMATHCSILAWKIPWTEECGTSQSKESQRVDWATSLHFLQNNNTIWNLSGIVASCSVLTLCGSTDCSLPGSSVHGIFQARILEWVVVSSSRGSSQPRDWTPALAGRFFTTSTTWEALLLSHFSRVWLCAIPETAAHQAPPSRGFSRQEHWSGLPFPSPMHESEKWKWSRSVVSDS